MEEYIKSEEVKNIMNCCVDFETLFALDKRAVEDLENNTHNIGQEEVLTIIREFIRCKNDFENLIARYKELEEKNKNNSEWITNLSKENDKLHRLVTTYQEEKLNKSGIYKFNINIKDEYIPKSKVKEEYVSKKELKRIIDKNMYLEMMDELRRVLEKE